MQRGRRQVPRDAQTNCREAVGYFRRCEIRKGFPRYSVDPGRILSRARRSVSLMHSEAISNGPLEIQQAFQGLRKVIGELPILASEQVGRFIKFPARIYKFPSDCSTTLPREPNLRSRMRARVAAQESFRMARTPRRPYTPAQLQ